jgi:hypothetical protein
MLCGSVILSTHSVAAQRSDGRATAPPPVLTQFSINDRAARVSATRTTLTLTHQLAGGVPTEFRVSARADFANTLWLPYTTPLRLAGWQPLVTGGVPCGETERGLLLRLFLQVRIAGGDESAPRGNRPVPRTESNVVSASVCVTRD